MNGEMFESAMNWELLFNSFLGFYELILRFFFSKLNGMRFCQVGNLVGNVKKNKFNKYKKIYEIVPLMPIL